MRDNCAQKPVSRFGTIIAGLFANRSLIAFLAATFTATTAAGALTFCSIRVTFATLFTVLT